MRMPRLFRFIFAALGLCLALKIAEARPTAKHTHSVAPTNCQVMADSVQKLYEAGDPVFLSWKIPSTCDPSLLYLAYYYQGLGYYLLSRWKESLYLLTLAKEIGGPKDEEILFHLWNVNKKLDRSQEMERATLELHQRFPNSFFLMEILDHWKPTKFPAQSWNFGFTSKISMSSNDYFDQVFANRLRAATGQSHGKHRFRESGSLTLKAKLDDKTLQGVQADVGGEYEYQGLTAEADYGAGFEGGSAKDPLLLVRNGFESRLADSNWNWLQGRLALGYSHSTKAGWNLGWKVNALQLAKDWRVLGIGHSQSIIFPSWILLSYIDYQVHWLHIPVTQGASSSGTANLDGLHTFLANLTPFLIWEKQSLGIGGTYYLSRNHYTGGVSRDILSNHSFTITSAYSYDIFTRMKINLNASYGRELNQKFSAPGYAHQTLYGIDVGFAYSY